MGLEKTRDLAWVVPLNHFDFAFGVSEVGHLARMNQLLKMLRTNMSWPKNVAIYVKT
jgi:hypothetical protein